MKVNGVEATAIDIDIEGVKYTLAENRGCLEIAMSRPPGAPYRRVVVAPVVENVILVFPDVRPEDR